jgi:muconate cycloisomerase
MTTIRRQTIVVLRIYCSDGIVGLGEGTTISGLSYGAESPESIKLAIDTYMAPLLRSSDPSRVAATMAGIGRAVVGDHFAKSAVETALLDAQGQACRTAGVGTARRSLARRVAGRLDPG